MYGYNGYFIDEEDDVEEGKFRCPKCNTRFQVQNWTKDKAIVTCPYPNCGYSWVIKERIR